MELKCPNCNTTFKVDENHYAAIQNQVRDEEFRKELKRRESEIEERYNSKIEAIRIKTAHDTESRLREMELLNNKLQIQIERLESQLHESEAHKKAELSDIINKKEREKEKIATESSKEINRLKAELELKDKSHQLDLINQKNLIITEINKKDLQISRLESDINSQKIAAEKRELELNEQHKYLLKAKDEEIQRYKDLKSKLSTKMLGETLEQHCLNMFNRARSLGLYPDAYFEKDNTIIDGTKGDFIFRDFLNGQEYISIMFEMKNEDDATTSKHHNSDFFQKLDKDRNKKNCQYAILVSTLETDNELYNEGIVDVSYQYEKMFVIRPQFFLAVIALLTKSARQGALMVNSLTTELEQAKQQSIDVTNFENRLGQFVDNFQKLVGAHIKKQDDALDTLNKAIEQAEKHTDTLRRIKSLFEASKDKLLKASDNAGTNFTIKKLVHGNPTMRAKFDQARNDLQ